MTAKAKVKAVRMWCVVACKDQDILLVVKTMDDAEKEAVGYACLTDVIPVIVTPAKRGKSK